MKISGYSYRHKLISTFSKNIEKKYAYVNRLSNIQLNKAYYFAVNYAQESKSVGRISQKEQETIIYKFADNALQDLPLVIEKSFAPGSRISGQFSETKNKQPKFVLCNTYSLGKDFNYDKPLATDVTVLSLSKDVLKISDKYEITQKKLHTAYKNINSVDEKNKIYVFNIPISFNVDDDDRDQLIFQSFRSYLKGDYVDTRTDDIGIFTFDKVGNIINFNHIPYKSKGMYTHALGNNEYAKGNTSHYYEGSPNPGFFKNITSISHNKKTFTFFNNVTENLNVSDSDQVKEFDRLKNSSGMVLTSTKKYASLILKHEDNIHFDFSSANFNEKPGSFMLYLKMI